MKIEIEKPFIPQFVADWIEQLYGQGFDSDDLLEILFSRDDDIAELRIFDWFTNDKERAIVAILYGYEVEQQPLYYAKIKGWELIVDERDIVYWMIDKQKNGLFVGELPFFSIDSTGDCGYVTVLTAREWNELGVYDDVNADFEEVD